ncbi:MAG: DNA polymerase IV [Candidatus Aenigmarchaeota archaeon]|nr:DNA polymerase IV [Candidatus Aenigmarchaeota archaeon]
MAVQQADRIIMHLDMDYFFAAVEERRKPELKGRPVVVGADPKEGRGRGVVSTCNYEARKFGIRSGMPISRAWQLCPEAAYLPVDFTMYRDASEEIMNIARKHARKVEQVSIDEAYMDATDMGDYDKALRLAERIRQEIKNSQNLTCSIGIGPNKLVAKIATDLKKPDAITTIKPDEVRQKVWPLSVGKLLGVGKKTAGRLREMGIRTIGDLAASDVSMLMAELGTMGYEFHQMANGMDERPVEEYWEPKSISREVTFEKDVNDSNMLTEMLEQLSKEVHKEAIDSSYSFRTITLKIRFSDFETHTKSRTVNITNSYELMAETAKELSKPFLTGRKAIRLVGVKASNLVYNYGQKSVGEFMAQTHKESSHIPDNF